MMTRASMDWRKLLLGMSLRFLAIIRKEHAEVSTGMESYILDDTTLEKTGFSIEKSVEYSTMSKANVCWGTNCWFVHFLMARVLFL